MKKAICLCVLTLFLLLLSSPAHCADPVDPGLQQAADKLETALSKAMRKAGQGGNPSLPELGGCGKRSSGSFDSGGGGGGAGGAGGGAGGGGAGGGGR